MNLSKSNLFWNLPYEIRYNLYKIFRRDSYIKNQTLRHDKVSGNVGSLYGFDKLKCIFIHIPKAGGISINKALFNNLGGGHRTIKEYSLIFKKHEFNNYYKFTLIRNPLDRLASAYFFLKNGGLNEYDKKWYDSNLLKYNSFEDFVLNWVTEENIYKGIHFVPQYSFVTINKKIVMDDIFKLENIEQSLEIINRKLNLLLKSFYKLNSSNTNINYKDIYSKRMLDIVKNVYSCDFKLYNLS